MARASQMPNENDARGLAVRRKVDGNSLAGVYLAILTELGLVCVVLSAFACGRARIADIVGPCWCATLVLTSTRRRREPNAAQNNGRYSMKTTDAVI
jgi:hypothetical protein